VVPQLLIPVGLANGKVCAWCTYSIQYIWPSLYYISDEHSFKHTKRMVKLMQSHSVQKMHVVARWKANLIGQPQVLLPHLQNSLYSEPMLLHLPTISLFLLKFATAPHLLQLTKSLAKPVYHTQKLLPSLVSTFCRRCFMLSVVDKLRSPEGGCHSRWIKSHTSELKP